jgi:hypothetical protein
MLNFGLSQSLTDRNKHGTLEEIHAPAGTLVSPTR